MRGAQRRSNPETADTEFSASGLLRFARNDGGWKTALDCPPCRSAARPRTTGRRWRACLSRRALA
ncbi:MAG: hypothetical protein CVT72_01415 [Alphaproteobacteria bacterium HGW-Alphaproteobacteria-11]|nr:MAG: hypothetical protein CVT72_01415 [Alphaproteobacteria bacterium HGW-Alphaproteobacteria-11]